MSNFEDYKSGKISVKEYAKRQFEKYQQEQRERVKTVFANHGLDIEKLTADQIDLILQPSEAPENFYHDGEVGAKTALAIWKTSLHGAGLTEAQIKSAEKINFAR